MYSNCKSILFQSRFADGLEVSAKEASYGKIRHRSKFNFQKTGKLVNIQKQIKIYVSIDMFNRDIRI